MALSFNDYMNLPTARRITVLEISKGANSYYISTDVFATEPGDTPANELYSAIVAPNGIPRINWQISDPLSGYAVKNYGIITLATHFLNDGTDLRSEDLHGADIILKITAPPTLYAYSNAVVLFTGKISKANGNLDGRFFITIADQQHQLNVKLIPPNRYDAVTEGANFPEELDGTTKQISVGLPRNVEPRLIDKNNYWYQWHDVGYADTYNTSQVFDNGVSLHETGDIVASSATSFTLPSSASAVDGYYIGAEIDCAGYIRQITAYVGATRVATVAAMGSPPAAGTYYVLYLFEKDTVNAKFRLLAPPAGQVTANVFGAASSGIPSIAGNFNEIAGAYAGIVWPDLQITLSDFANGYTGLFFDETVSIAEAFSRLCRSAVGWWSFDRDGVLIAKHFYAPLISGVMVFGANDILSLSWDEDPLIIWRISIRYQPNWTIINNPAASLSESDKKRVLKRFREYYDDEPTVLSDHDDAQEFVFTSYDYNYPASAVTKIKSLWQTRRYLATIKVPMRFPVLSVGQTIELDGVDSFLDGTWVIRGIEDNAGGETPTQTLKVWR